MSPYERGFARGEAESFQDRRRGRTRLRPSFVEGEWERGFWDAYSPRDAAWALRNDVPAQLAELPA